MDELIEYWSERTGETRPLWFVYEKTPWFWAQYFRLIPTSHQMAHPNVASTIRVAWLKRLRTALHYFLGRSYYNVTLLPLDTPEQLEMACTTINKDISNLLFMLKRNVFVVPGCFFQDVDGDGVPDPHHHETHDQEDESHIRDSVKHGSISGSFLRTAASAPRLLSSALHLRAPAASEAPDIESTANTNPEEVYEEGKPSRTSLASSIARSVVDTIASSSAAIFGTGTKKMLTAREARVEDLDAETGLRIPSLEDLLPSYRSLDRDPDLFESPYEGSSEEIDTEDFDPSHENADPENFSLKNFNFSSPAAQSIRSTGSSPDASPLPSEDSLREGERSAARSSSLHSEREAQHKRPLASPSSDLRNSLELTHADSLTHQDDSHTSNSYAADPSAATSSSNAHPSLLSEVNSDQSPYSWRQRSSNDIERDEVGKRGSYPNRKTSSTSGRPTKGSAHPHISQLRSRRPSTKDLEHNEEQDLRRSQRSHQKSFRSPRSVHFEHGTKSPRDILVRKELCRSLEDEVGMVREIERWCDQKIAQNEKESFWRRHWIKCTIFAAAASFGMWQVWKNRKKWINELKETKGALITFFHKHALEPLKSIWYTIRYENGGGIVPGVTNPDSLDAEMASLVRMVDQWHRDNGDASLSPAEIERAVRVGILPGVMEAWEEEVPHPIYNIVAGDLLRLALIRVQQQKVELSHLLQQNAINFQLLALLPSLLVFFGGFSLFRSYLKQKNYPTEVYKQLRLDLRRVASLTVLGASASEPDLPHLNASTQSHLQAPLLTVMRSEHFGELQCLLSQLLDTARGLPRGQRESFMEDLGDLAIPYFTAFQRESVLQRMYATYSFLSNDVAT